MKRGLYLIFMLGMMVTLFQGCADDGFTLNPGTGVPYAKFTFTKNGHMVTFINKSTNATSYKWDFGNNTYSYEENPVYYFQSGIYTVTLTAFNGGNTSVFSKQILI